MNNRTDLIISTQGLTKNYNGVQALKFLDLKVPRNSIFGFLGPNGAGKSTAIRLMLGLIKPSSGAGSVFGLDIVNDSSVIRNRIGYLPQNPRYYNYMTAREVLSFTAGFFKFADYKMIEERIEEVLSLTGLQDKADRKVKGFSGGELQRLGIAQAQVNNPELLILDEPAASLDPMGRRDVLDVMRALKGRTTIFYSTHILDDVERVSDTVGILNKGELVALAPIEELLRAKESAVYDVIIQGNSDCIRSQIEAQPWVASVNESTNGGSTKWSLTATDEISAERNFLRMLMLDENIIVKEFIRRRDDLEDVFMRIVEGESNA
jgi:ABC-2 type transport system ATP-binding protein